MISLNTDNLDLILQQNLYNTLLDFNKTMNAMTTGYKVNQAKDNAANYSIINDLSTKISSMIQIQQNTDNGLSLLETAEGGMENILNLLTKLRTLAVDASNDIYDEQSRNALQLEADALIEQIGKIKASTEFDGMNLYETPAEETPVEPIEVHANLNQLSLYNEEENSSNLSSYAFTPILEDEQPSSSNISSFSAPRMMAAGVMPLAAGGTIEGAFNFSGNQTQTVTIDGVQYTIKNLTGVGNDISYSKDTLTGKLTFIGNNFEIRGELDVAHNLVISGENNYIYGGNLNDTIEELNTEICGSNYIYGGNGNDNITARGYRTYLYGEDGDDELTNYNQSSVYGGKGNDTFNLYYNAPYGTYNGGDGNDTFNIYVDRCINLNGDDGDDTFNLIGTRTGVILDGGSGTNIVTGDVGTENTTINVVGANAGQVSLVRNVAQTIEINGKNYTFSTTNSTAKVTYKIESSGQITFTQNSNRIKIQADANQSHNVALIGNLDFYGGNQGDTIETKTVTGAIIYCGSGNNNITLNNDSSVYCQAGNNTINVKARKCYISGDSGINNVIVNANLTHIISYGNMSVTLYGNDNCVYGEGENNHIISNTGTNNFICGFGSADNAQGILLADTNVITEHSININDINYTVKNTNQYSTNALLYSVNDITNEISFMGRIQTINGQLDVAHNVIIDGYSMKFYGGNLNDTITQYGLSNSIYGGEGNDIITSYGEATKIYGEGGNDTLNLNGANQEAQGGDGDDIININRTNTNRSINGGLGDDTYNINAKATKITDDGGNNIYNITTNGVNLTGGSGNDTFYVLGNNNTVNGGGGDDYFVVDGNNNNINGGTGTDYYLLNGTGNSTSNAVQDPTSGMLLFSSIGEVKTLTLDGKSYTLKNNGTNNNRLNYSLNQNTHTITVEGDGFIITSDNNQENIINIRGNNNTINGSNLVDKITIEQGSGNTINGLGGNDILTSNTTNNSILGGDGNDEIVINASTNMEVNAGNGNDNITINASNCTNIKAESGDNTINVNGTNNTIKAKNGNNNVMVNQDSNNINLGSGNNNIKVLANDNTVIAGNGNNTLGIQGNSNNLTVQKSTENINVVGSNNTLTVVQGAENISVKGDENTISALIGNKKITVNGNENEITTGSGNDTFNVRGDSNVIDAGSGKDTLNIKGDENILESESGNNEVSLQGNNNYYQGGSDIDNIKISGNGNIAKGGLDNDTFMISSGSSNVVDGEGGARNTVINNGSATNFTNAVDITPRPFNLSIKVDIGANENSFISSSISFNLFDFSVDFSDANSALESIEKIDELIANVQDQLLNIGTAINKISSAQEAQAIKLENLISSRSTLRDADIAKLSSHYIRNQILQQATATLLSTTRNLRAENILQLIYGLRNKSA